MGKRVGSKLPESIRREEREGACPSRGLGVEGKDPPSGGL